MAHLGHRSPAVRCQGRCPGTWVLSVSEPQPRSSSLCEAFCTLPRSQAGLQLRGSFHSRGWRWGEGVLCFSLIFIFAFYVPECPGLKPPVILGELSGGRLEQVSPESTFKCACSWASE